MALTGWTRVSTMPARDEQGLPRPLPVRMPAMRREDVYDPVSDMTITVWSEIFGGETQTVTQVEPNGE